jgi:hypothetical protein
MQLCVPLGDILLLQEHQVKLHGGDVKVPVPVGPVLSVRQCTFTVKVTISPSTQLPAHHRSSDGIGCGCGIYVFTSVQSAASCIYI